jgi:hypothetical protein
MSRSAIESRSRCQARFAESAPITARHRPSVREHSSNRQGVLTARLLEDYLSRVSCSNDLPIFAAILVALHLHLVGALDLLQHRVSLFHVGLDGRQTLVLPQDQEVPLAAIIEGSKDLVRLLEPRLDLRIFSLL